MTFRWESGHPHEVCVEDYDWEPDWLGRAIPPGEILLEDYLKPLGLGLLQAAERLGISLNRLNEIALGKRGI